MLTRSFGRLALLAVFSVLVGLVACGDGDGSTPTSTEAPTNVVAEPGDGYIWVSWDFGGATDEFVVYREAVSSSSVQLQKLQQIASVDGDERQFFDLEVDSGTSYTYAVALAGGEPVGMAGGPASPAPGNILRVLFGGPVPEDSASVITSEPAGIDCRAPGDPGCQAEFPSIAEVTLSSGVDDGYIVTWDGCDSTPQGVCTVNMSEQLDPANDTQRTVTATFVAAANVLEIDVNEPGTGRVVNVNDLGSYPSIDCTGSCTYEYQNGLIIGLDAQPIDPANYSFSEWDGACSGVADTTCTVTMDASKSVAANFRLVPPQIVSFSSSSGQLKPNQSTTLSWDVSGGGDIAAGDLSIVIEPGVGSVSDRSGSVTVSPSKTTTYTLTAINASGSATSEQTVVVGAKPIIESFTAIPGSIKPGMESVLSWEVTGVGDVTLGLDHGLGNITGESSVRVSPDVTTTFTLTAVNEFGSDSASVTVRVGEAPEIENFSASPASIWSGNDSRLDWSVSGPGGITLTIDPGSIDVTGTSSLVVSPTTKTTYRLTATNEFGEDTDVVSVKVRGDDKEDDDDEDDGDD